MGKVFFTCGPTQLYPTVPAHLHAGLENKLFSISHRSEKAMQLYSTAVEGLRKLMSIPIDYEIFFVASGTEGMERVIQNCVAVTSGHVVCGAFSRRWMTMSQQLGKKTEQLSAPDGQIPDIRSNAFSPAVELICITHNETSTGAMFQSADIAGLRKQYPHALVAVDVVSSAPTVSLDFSSVDCVLFSVQKGFGLPAGLGVIVVGPRAMAKNAELIKKMSVGSYHSFMELKKYAEKNQTPDTPNVLDIYLLGAVAADLNAIGIDQLRSQTKERAEKLYQMAEGNTAYSAFVKAASARSLTTIVFDVAGGSARVIDSLKEQGIFVSSGYKEFKDTQIRIGNFPAHSVADFERLLAALKNAI